jgi:hypothetical protein
MDPLFKDEYETRAKHVPREPYLNRDICIEREAALENRFVTAPAYRYVFGQSTSYELEKRRLLTY